MIPLISTTNRDTLKSLLLSLDPATIPLWGKMKPQQMVEHLVDAVIYTNGKKETACERPAADAERSKQVSVYSDRELPKNVILDVLPEYNLYSNISKAIVQLMVELHDFDAYFETPGTTAVHPAFGAMHYKEWIIWHSKHFTHHFKQFGLLPL